MEAGTTVQITMPQMGDSVSEGTVLEWHKQVGEQVEPDETLLEVSADKVDAEVPAPVGGTLVRILVEADETVPVGTVLGESVQEGTVLEWHKNVGDPVSEGETLVEISTDKVDAEIPSPAAGTVVEIL